MTSILEQDIDLNKLFHLNHSFDLLKTVIEALLKSNKNLEKRLSDLEGDREKQENKLKDEIDRLKGIYNEKFNVIFSRLDKHEGDIASINLKIDGLCSQEDMEDLKKKVEKNSNGIDKHSEQIEDIYKRLKKLDELIEGINIRLSEMNVFQLPQKDDEELSDTDRFLKLLESLKVTIFNKLGNLDSRLEEDERDISGIKADIQALKEKSAYFNENITILFAKIEELKNLIHKSPNDDIEKNLKKFIEAELNEILKKLEIRINQLQLTNIEGKISDSDLKLINDLMRRVIELENLYRIISNQPKIDELEEEIRKIYKLLGLKLEDKDLQPLREIYQNLLKRVERLEDLIKENNNEDLKYEIKQIKIKLEYLESLIQGFNSGNQGEKPQGDFVNLQTFLIFKSNTEKELKSSNEKISDIYRILDEILAELRNKVNYEDLKRLEEFLLKKLEELRIACLKKFADKNDTNNNFKYLEGQIKLLMEMKGTNNKADNWLLAKKPIGGNSCASCEAYIGDLWENREFIPWNKMPIRDPSDKVYRIGNGFSKMLNMLNVEQVNLNEVGTTTNNGKRNISTAKPGYRSNRLGNSYNKKTDLPPVNGERLKDLNLSADNLEVVEDSEYKNIEVGKKEPSM